MTIISDRVQTCLGSTNEQALLAQRLIASEFLKLDLYRRQLMTQRNRLVPISRLPPEILSAIFVHVAPLMESRTSYEAAITKTRLKKDSCESHFHEDREQDIKDIRSLISASQVCRHWRGVALQAGALWANLWTENTRWRTEMLTRAYARQARLEVYHPREEDDSEMGWMRTLLASGIPYRRLCISMHEVDNLAEMLSQPAPWLEVAHIECDSRDEKGWADEAEERPIPSHLFAGIAPRLRHLRVEGDYVLTDILRSPILHNLTCLELVTENTKDLIPSALDLLHALNQMPRLCILNIENCFPVESLELHSSVDHFLFPNISYLGLRGESAGCANFAQYIRVHPECRLEYWIIREFYDSFLTSDTVPPLLSVIPDSSSVPARAFYMSLNSTDLEHSTACWDVRLPSNFLLAGESRSCIVRRMNDGKRFDLTYQSGYEIQPDESVDLDYDIVTKVLRCLNLEKLQDLAIVHNGYINMQRFGFWPAALRRMSSVEKLVLGDCVAAFPILHLIALPKHFASYFEPADRPILQWSKKSNLDIPARNANTTTRLPILLPRLSFLYLKRWRFRPNAPLPRQFLASLRAIAARRRREYNGHPLCEFHIINCEISPAQVLFLKGMRIAESLIWDGKTWGSGLLPGYIDN